MILAKKEACSHLKTGYQKVRTYIDLFYRAAIWQPALNLLFQPAYAIRIDAVTSRRAFNFTLDQTGLAQHLEMLADG